MGSSSAPAIVGGGLHSHISGDSFISVKIFRAYTYVEYIIHKNLSGSFTDNHEEISKFPFLV